MNEIRKGSGQLAVMSSGIAHGQYASMSGVGVMEDEAPRVNLLPRGRQELIAAVTAGRITPEVAARIESTTRRNRTFIQKFREGVFRFFDPRWRDSV
ncbi:MAG: hypothetical protein KDA57_15955 [Planctomycetales bacterium]|nr:hypothetical protein [Planctomycetales bacterium]